MMDIKTRLSQIKITKGTVSELAYKVTDIAVITAIAYALYTVFLDRSLYIHKIFKDSLNCESCLESTIFYHDSPLFAGIILLAIVSLSTRRFFLYIPLRITLLAAIAIYIADIATLKEFFTRLRINDVLQYGEKTDLVWRHIENTGMLESQFLSLPAIAGLILLTILFPPRRQVKTKWLLFLLILPVAGLITGLAIDKPRFVHEWAVRNVVDTNLKPGVAIKYSEEFRKSTLIAAKEEAICRPAMNQPKNVVLLLLESWSPYHSQLWSGINDWTPKLDKLAQEGLYYSNNIASGFTTNEGLMALLAENEFLAPIKSFFAVYMFEATWNRERTAAKIMKEAGYHTGFLTTGNLSFSAKDKWLKNVGFEHIDGHDNPLYDGIPRLHFDSAPDKKLYEASLSYLDNLDNQKPHFTVIETVSTHHPYIHPETKKRNEEDVFRYMDDTASDFIEQLRERDFFKDGILIVASDHRAMTPVHPEERKVLGFKSPSKIPMFILGDGISPQNVAGLTHQSELIDTLEDLSHKESCQTNGHVSWLRPEVQQEEKCVFHAQGVDRDIVDVICSNGHGSIKLQGDETRFRASKGLSTDQKKSILLRLNAHRIQGDIDHLDFWKKKTEANQ
ncbi:MAG: LTA synthase family protein [Cellvibrionaceae bacterium]|nr:LTA synthase family protein [Cellvibrionaceae bacterium]